MSEFSKGISRNSAPTGIVRGPDGNLWFTERKGNRIGRITPSGKVTEVRKLPTPNSQPQGITVGPDGDLWFTETRAQKIGKITPKGKLTEYPVANSQSPAWIAKGSDGNLWFTEPGDFSSIPAGEIGRITPSGVQTFYSNGISGPMDPLGPLGGPTTGYGQFGQHPNRIVAGPGGNLWFSESSMALSAVEGQIARITPQGRITEFPYRSPQAIAGLAVGSDRNLWYTDAEGNVIGQVNVRTGRYRTFYPLALQTLRNAAGIASFPHGSLWFADPVYGPGRTRSAIGRITTGGRVHTWTKDIPRHAVVDEMTSGPGKTMWFTQQGPRAIGRIEVGRFCK